MQGDGQDRNRQVPLPWVGAQPATILVIDNDNNVAVDGVPPYTFLTVVEGGTEQQVAERIYRGKPAGIQSFGDIEVEVRDSKGYPHTIRFSRPTQIRIAVECEVVRAEDRPLQSLVTIKEAIIAHINALPIGQDVVWSRLFEPGNLVEGVDVRTISSGLEGETLGTDDVEIGDIQKAVTDDTLVSIVEV